MKTKKILLAILVSLFISSTVHAKAVWVKSVKAPVLEAPRLGSKVLFYLKKGEKINVLSEKGFWLKIDYNNKTGWIYKMLVSNSRPMSKVTVIEKMSETEPAVKARRRASANISAAAARGLVREYRRRSSGKYFADYKALKIVENINITQEEVEKFLNTLR